jgi:spermidine synthase
VTGWVEETLHDDFRIKLKADKVLYDSQTDFQRIVVFENASFGRVLTLDGVVQTTEADEFIYHEMLAHVPVLAHGAARRVLIVGGGDGGMLEEVLKHRDIETVTQVEIDQGVIDLSKQYLGSICGDAFEDPRTRVVIADGVEYLARCDERYDVVIIDSTDPIGPGEALFTKDFYASCHRALTPGGILVTQNGVPFLQSGELTNSVRYMAEIFADASCYMATVPTYVGGPMAFGWASDNADLRRTPADTLRQRFQAAGFTTRYYTPEVHAAAFALPGYIAELIA